MEHKLIVEYNETYNFNKVTCSEGHYLTSWDKQDIKEYSATKLMYCPVNANLDIYYCITDEEHNEYIKKQEEAFIDEENRKIENE